MNKFLDRVRGSIANFFEGDEGSFFWLCKQAWIGIKRLVSFVNEMVAGRQAENARKRQLEEEESTLAQEVAGDNE